MQTVHAYYDGHSIQLEEPLELQRNDKLLVSRINDKREFVTTSDIEVASLADIGQNDFLSEEEIQLLNEHDVEYLLVGGYAVNVYGYNRPTCDLDIWVNRTLDNGKKLIDAIEHFGYNTTKLHEKTFTEPLVFQIGEPPFLIDILNGIVGVQFEDAFQRRKIIHDEDVEINVIHINDLKVNKLISGRHKDLDDLENLSKE